VDDEIVLFAAWHPFHVVGVDLVLVVNDDLDSAVFNVYGGNFRDSYYIVHAAYHDFFVHHANVCDVAVLEVSVFLRLEDSLG